MNTAIKSSEIANLIEFLNRLDQENRRGLAATLEPRKVAEADFHDNRADRQVEEIEEAVILQKQPNKKHYKYIDAPKQYMNDWIRANSKNKIFLDYACGEGQSTIEAAKAGATLAIGIDISAVSVDHAKDRAKKEGVEGNTLFLLGDCEQTGFPDSCVDTILCCGMLHHLDLTYAFPEMRRILKPGGKSLAFEALNYNPLIKLYRKITPELRTEWEKEHILSLKDVGFAKNFFSVENVRYWNILSIFSAYVPFLASTFRGIDKLLTKIPGIQLLAWIFTFEMVKQSRKN